MVSQSRSVGESKDSVINVAGTDYPMDRHGFARHQEFKLLESNSDSAVFELTSTEETKNHFPFDFRLTVTFQLNGNSLQQSFDVENTGEGTLGFQLGGHPAFSVPYRDGERYNDYQVVFGEEQTLHRHLLSAGGLYTGETRLFLDNEKSFDLSYQLFEEDALVFKNITAKKVWIQKKSGGKRLLMEYEGFPHFGIWSVPGADYVCLEPWIGCADQIDQPEDFFSKDNLVSLLPGKHFQAKFTTSIHQ